MRRRVVGHENIRLSNVKKGNQLRNEETTDPFEIAVRETGIMEVFQTLSCPV
jgi:hypothetical protein